MFSIFFRTFDRILGFANQEPPKTRHILQAYILTKQSSSSQDFQGSQYMGKCQKWQPNHQPVVYSNTISSQYDLIIGTNQPKASSHSPVDFPPRMLWSAGRPPRKAFQRRDHGPETGGGRRGPDCGFRWRNRWITMAKIWWFNGNQYGNKYGNPDELWYNWCSPMEIQYKVAPHT